MELGIDILPIPVINASSGRSVDVSIAENDALVAVVEDAAIRNLTNDNFYRFGS